MPIKVKSNLPARDILENENIFVMTENRAMTQNIRPLKVLVLNLMPTKIVTETQILRKLSNTPLQIEVEFLQTATYRSTHTDPSPVSYTHLNVIIEIAMSIFACSVSSLFSVTTLLKKSSSMFNSLRPCSKVIPKTSFLSSFLGT